VGRASQRLLLARRALLRSLGPRTCPVAPQRILVAHHLLLGDTLMLAALFAALRARWPAAAIDCCVDPAYLPLFSGQPYAVRALAYNPRRDDTVEALVAHADANDGYDLAIVPGDNRYALLARALGARWVVAMAGDRPVWKNRLCDQLLPWPTTPTALADIFASLAGVEPVAYLPGDWPAPAAAPFALPAAPYAVLHVGAGSPLRYWPSERWQQLAEKLAEQGQTVVWSCGPKESALIDLADPAGRWPSYPGNLDLAQLWHLLAGAALLVCPDTGIAHLAKLVGVPTVCLFGPGSPTLFGAGHFWRQAPFLAAGEACFPCRDQRSLFKRELAWVRRCQRGVGECGEARCMAAITVDGVLAASSLVLGQS
jgi:ADP-heptose:LPS heptosyltransferase